VRLNSNELISQRIKYTNDWKYKKKKAFDVALIVKRIYTDYNYFNIINYINFSLEKIKRVQAEQNPIDCQSIIIITIKRNILMFRNKKI
jgi:hypothetical protein